MGPVLYMASTKLLVGLLGILLAFAPELIYDGYGTSGERWGLSPLDDLHVAGLLMALEQSIVMGVALVYLFTRMLVRGRPRGRAGRALRGGGLALLTGRRPRTRSAWASVSAGSSRWSRAAARAPPRSSASMLLGGGLDQRRESSSLAARAAAVSSTSTRRRSSGSDARRASPRARAGRAPSSPRPC